MSERFIVSTSLPAYLVEEIDKQAKQEGLTRSEFVEKAFRRNKKKIEEILPKKTKDVSISLPFHIIEQMKELEESHKTTVGRVIYLSLILSMREPLSSNQSGEMFPPPPLKGEKYGKDAKKKRKQDRKGNSKSLKR